MAVVAVSGGREGTQEPSLAERVDQAGREVFRLRQRVLEVEPPYLAAIAEARFQDAADLEADAKSARADLVVAEALASALAGAQDTLNREQNEREAAQHDHERREQAQAAMGQAIQDERDYLESARDRLDVMWSCLSAAQAAYREALELEQQVGRCQRRVLEARVMAGELDQVPNRIAGSNVASVVAEREEIVRVLNRWTR